MFVSLWIRLRYIRTAVNRHYLIEERFQLFISENYAAIRLQTSHAIGRRNKHLNHGGAPHRQSLGRHIRSHCGPIPFAVYALFNCYLLFNELYPFSVCVCVCGYNKWVQHLCHQMATRTENREKRGKSATHTQQNRKIYHFYTKSWCLLSKYHSKSFLQIRNEKITSILLAFACVRSFALSCLVALLAAA